jgi:hypothetical protein
MRSPPLGPLRPISFTASEIMARRIVDRLCQEPPRGLSWRDYATREISRALVLFGKATPAQPARREP